MATPATLPLSWICPNPNCGQLVLAGQTCPNCAPAAGAGAGAPPPPTPRPPQPPTPQPAPQLPPRPVTPTEEEEDGSNRRRLIAIIAGGVLLLVLLVILMARGCGGPKRTPTSPAPAAPAPTITTPPPASPVKPSTMPRTPATPTTSPQELARGLKRISSQLEEINHRIPTEPTGAAVNILGEIRGILEQGRQAAPAASPAARPQHERLSDKELERRYKERLLQQEP